MTNILAQADSAIGCHDPLLYIFIVNTQTGNAGWIEFREVEGQKRQEQYLRGEKPCRASLIRGEHPHCRIWLVKANREARNV